MNNKVALLGQTTSGSTHGSSASPPTGGASDDPVGVPDDRPAPDPGEALTGFRAAHPGLGEVPIFPHPRQRRHRGKPVDRHLAAYWLKRAYELSGLQKPDGSLWHAFRRSWATERKDLPVKDVAAAGGWKDIITLMGCYQQADEETMRSVVEYKKPQHRASKEVRA